MYDFIKDCWAWYQFSSGGDRENHHAGWGIQNGHKWYYEKHIKKPADWFYSKFGKRMPMLLHLPFGKTILTNQKDMAFDEYLSCKRDVLHYFHREFVETYKPLVEKGHRVITYLGNVDHTADFKGDTEIVKMHKIMECMRPIFDAGTEVCIDAQAYHLRSEFSHDLYNMFKDYGVKMSIEATPKLDSPVFDEQAVILWHLFNRRHIRHTDRSFPAAGDNNWYPKDPLVIVRDKDVTGIDPTRYLQILSFDGIPMIPRNAFHDIIRASDSGIMPVASSDSASSTTYLD